MSVETPTLTEAPTLPDTGHALPEPAQVTSPLPAEPQDAATVQLLRMPGGQSVVLRHTDLVFEPVDAIVNAANERLKHGGGVAGAISRAGGPAIQAESDGIGYCPVRHCTITGAGTLPARYIIHAVGPQGGDDHAEWLLRETMLNVLGLAEALCTQSIAVPAISSGIFGFPKRRCAEILVRTAVAFFVRRPYSSLREVRYSIIDAETVAHFKAVMESLEVPTP